MSKFKDFSKSNLFNAVDWFNYFGSFVSIFDGIKNVNIISETEVSFFSDENLRNPTFKLIHKSVKVLKDNPFDIATGLEISKFMLLTACKFKGDSFAAMSYVNFFLMKNEIPYIRVGGDYYKIIEKIDRYGGKNRLLKVWKKDEIKEDHTKALLKMIYKYDDFTLIPNNKTFIPVQNGCFNLYSKFNHDEATEDVLIKDIPFSIGVMNHIFGEQFDLGLKYMKLLYEHPTQILPILSLVSTERGTGKTTFLNWIQMIYGENSVMISPEDLMRGFNSIYATKNIIMVDETVVEKSTTVEKLKSLATAKTISISQKFVSEYSIPFYAKIILCTNKEKDFMRIDEEEIRFWVRKIKPVTKLNTNIEKNLFDEIPKFLRFLSSLPEIDFSKSRMVFTNEEIITENLLHIKEESRSQLYKEIEILIEDHFNQNNINEFYATPTDIKDRWFRTNNQISISYIRKVLKDEMKGLVHELTRYNPFGEISLNEKVGTPFKFTRKIQLVKNEILEDSPF